MKPRPPTCPRGAAHLFVCSLAVATAGCKPSAAPPAAPSTQPSPAISHPPTTTPARPPNFVLIFCDDLRYDYLGCTGHPFLKTPNIDRLAAEGALFENAFVVTSLCCPGRATVLTGLYGHRCGVTSNQQDLDYQTTRILPEYLREAGYTTAFIGKYHLGQSGRPRPGFDHWVSFEQDHGQGTYFDTEMIVDGVPTPTEGYNCDVLADFAVRWIERQGPRPFFLMLSLKNPHTPMTPPPRHAALYETTPIPLPASFADSPQSLPLLVRYRVDPAGAQRQAQLEISRKLAELSARGQPVVEFIREYSRMIPSIDDSVGSLRVALEKTGVLNDTVLVFNSDNGMILGEHGIVQKELAYEPSIRVPLIIRYPPVIRPGMRLHPQALNLDLAPTILGLAGVDVPAQMQGRNLVPLLRDSTAPWREDWLFVARYLPGQRPAYLALRTDRWKYIRYLRNVLDEELFDLEADPDERTNLAARPDAATRLEDMRQRLRAALAREGAPAEWFDVFVRPWGESP